MAAGEVSAAIKATQARAFEYGDRAIEEVFQLVDQAIIAANDITYPDEGLDLPVEVPSIDPHFAINQINGLSVKAKNAYLDEWLSKYRLIIDENFKDLFSFDYAEDFLEEVLQNGYIVNKSIHNQIVSRAKDAEYTKSRQLKDEAVLQFVSKGFSIPSGALASRLDAIDQDLSNNVSGVIREIALKEEDLNTDMIKTAVDQALRLRPQAVQIAADFASKYTQMYNVDAESAKNFIAGLSIINDSRNNYDKSLISIYEIKNRVNSDKLNRDLDYKKFNNNKVLETAKLKTSVTLSAADAVARIGAASVSAQTTIAQLGANVLTE